MKTYHQSEHRNLILFILSLIFAFSLGHRFNTVMDEHQTADHQLETFNSR